MTGPTRQMRTSVQVAQRSVETVEAERDFLLRSLADLEAESAAGELSEERFRELYDEYTTQAAVALRALDRLRQDAVVTDDAQPERRRRRWVPAAIVIVVVAVIGTVFLVRSLASRQSGQTITGNAQSTAPDLATLAAAAADRPGDPQAQLDYGFALLNTGQSVDALRAFDAASLLDPTNPVPQAYAGWILYMAGLPDDALARLEAATSADPNYPDAYFFRGMVLLRGKDDPAGARVELGQYLRLAPPSPLGDQVQTLIDGLDQAAGATTTSPAG